MDILASQSEMLQRAFRGSISDVGFFQQAAVLGLPKEHFIDRSVLDIGSGKTNRFASDVQRHFGNTAVFSVNPQLAFEKICREREISRADHNRSVAALAQGFLPFRDRAFKTIVSVLAVPNTLTTEEVPYFINESWRLLDLGGTASFWPHTLRKTSEARLMVEPFMTVEAVDPDVLMMLPKPYQHLKTRIVIKRPVDETSVDAIAHLGN